MDSSLDTPLKEFSGWRCLWDPEKAQDNTTCKPFARLRLRIESAQRLLAADNYLIRMSSDPYVTISINGEREVHKTKTITRDLNPTWDEEFYLDINHPESWLRLKVFDEDFGRDVNKVVDFVFGAEDDFLGWTDVQLGCLPFNEDVGGWRNLNHPDDWLAQFQNQGGITFPQELHHAGAIKIRMKLEINHEQQKKQFFAMCLPAPKAIHKCEPHSDTGPRLDLPKFVMQVTELYKKWTRIQASITHVWDGITTYLSTPFRLWVCGILLCWHPNLILPILLFAVGIAILKSDFSEADIKKEEKVLDIGFVNDMKKAGTQLRASVRQSRASLVERLHVTKEQITRDENSTSIMKTQSTKEYYENRQPLLGRDSSSDVEAQTPKIKRMMMALRQMQKILPSDLEHDLIDAEPQIKDLLEQVHWLEGILNKPFTRILIKALFVIIIVVFFYWSDYQVLILQIYVSFLMTTEFLQDSVFGRIYQGLVSYVHIHRGKIDGFEFYSEGGDAIAAGRSCTPKAITVGTPTWCEQCGALLIGIKNQGVQCTACERILCHECAKISGGNCKPIRQIVASVSVKEPKVMGRISEQNLNMGLFSQCCTCSGPKDSLEREEYGADQVTRTF